MVDLKGTVPTIISRGTYISKDGPIASTRNWNQQKNPEQLKSYQTTIFNIKHQIKFAYPSIKLWVFCYVLPKIQGLVKM